MILADSSAWVEYDRASGSAVDLRIRALIEGDGPFAVTEPVVMEVAAGARSDQPTAHLDTALRAVLQELASQRQALGPDVLYPAHDVAEVLAGSCTGGG